jgi:hypothetical protein
VADQAQALVDGFHVAFLAARSAGTLLLLLVRRKDVVAVGAGEAALADASPEDLDLRTVGRLTPSASSCRS